MNRRALLAAVPASLLAGCTASPGSDTPDSGGGDGGDGGDGGGGDGNDGDGGDGGGDDGGDPELVDASLSVLDVASEVTEPGATVDFDPAAGVVTVTGTVVGSDGCKTAALDAATYDPGADRLTVAVVTEDRADAGDACTEALVHIEYETRATFEGGLPAAVTVTHDGDPAASAERSG